jgi:hypothetical protein
MAGARSIALSGARESPVVPPKLRGLAPRAFSLAVTAVLSTPPLIRIAVLGGVPMDTMVSVASTSRAISFDKPTEIEVNRPAP